MIYSNLINEYRISQRGFSSETPWRLLEFVYTLFSQKYFSDYQDSFPNQAKFWEMIWFEWCDNLFEIERKTNHLSYNLKIFFVTWIFKKEFSKQAQEQDMKT